MSIYKKLFEAKKDIGKISKDSTNPFFKSKYFDINGLLEHVEPILAKHGVLLLQPVNDGKVITQLIDSDTHGVGSDAVESSIELPNITDPQKLGSAITYFRRYTLQSLLGLQAEDDDANKASGKTTKIDHSKTELPWLDSNSAAFKGGLSKGTDLQTLRTYFRISKKTAEDYTKLLSVTE
jgi:hypothetical protein